MLKLIQKIWPFHYFLCLSTQLLSKRVKILLTAGFKTHNELVFITKKKVLFIRRMCVQIQVPITFKRKPKQFLNEWLVLDWRHHSHMNESCCYQSAILNWWLTTDATMIVVKVDKLEWNKPWLNFFLLHRRNLHALKLILVAFCYCFCQMKDSNWFRVPKTFINSLCVKLTDKPK